MRLRIRAVGLLPLIVLSAAANAEDTKTAPLRRPEVWAIIVGVDDFDDPAIPDSNSAVREANSVIRWFRGPAGWDRHHSLYLRDLGSRDPGQPDAPAALITPTRKNLDWAFGTWLRSKAKPGDTVVFYFAGKSMALVKPRAGLEPEVSYRIVTTDTRNADLRGSTWSLDEALDDLAERGRFQIVCWLETSIQNQPQGDKSTARPSGREWLHALARWPGVTAWLAADETLAGEPAVVEPGNVFTDSLLKGLGTLEHPQNLAACLRSLQENPELKKRGFHTVGGVTADATLWSKLIAETKKPEKPEMVLQLGHADQVTALTTTADGNQIISASMDSTVRIWSTPDRALLRILTGHQVGATCLALSADGRWLISGGGRSEVFVRDTTREYASRLIPKQPHEKAIAQIVMFPDRTHFLSVDRGGKAYLWDLSVTPLDPRPWLAETEVLEVVSGGDEERGVVAARGSDGSVRYFGPKGQGGVVLPLPDQGRPSALALSADGRWLAAGFEKGTVLLRDMHSGRVSPAQDGSAPVRLLSFSRAGDLVAGSDQGLKLLWAATHWTQGAVLTDQPVRTALFSPEGGYLAASVSNKGTVQLWKIADGAKVDPVSVDDEGRWFSLAFRGDGRTLILGGHDGTIQTRTLEGAEKDDLAWQFRPNRGMVKQLSASPDRRYLLLRNELSKVQLWDLKSRVCRGLPGRWGSAVFLDDQRVALAAAAEASEGTSGLVLFDTTTGKFDPSYFARAAEGFKVVDDVIFAKLVVSADGTTIAGAAEASQTPLVCVWQAKTGRLTHWIEGLDNPVVSVDLATDSHYLLTAADAPEARLWDLNAGRGALAEPLVVFSDPTARNLTCAALRPDHADQIVTGHSDGRVMYWTWKDGKARRENAGLVNGLFAGEVKALAFTPDGRQLAAAGDDTTIWLGEMEPIPRRLKDLEARPHHFEQINSLVMWQGTPMLLSGSDDTTVRFWDLKTRTLWGTFSANTHLPPAEEPKNDALRDLDWVLFTPEGVFDASTEGRSRVRFRHREQAQEMEQFDKTLYSFDLSEKLRSGEITKVSLKMDDTPLLAIDPPARVDLSNPETVLTVSLNANDLRDVRLYHNSVPIPCGIEPDAPSAAKKFQVRVRLLKGLNRFYAMASREGAPDGRSHDVLVRYEGPMEPGQLHVVAIGVGGYSRRRLQFAVRDAEQLSDVLHSRGFEKTPGNGLRIVLTNDKVNDKSVGEAFRQVAQRVRQRPQDTVVVFLAGHADVFSGQTWCLLLPSFPFSTSEPLAVAARAGVEQDKTLNVKDSDLLPYSLVARHLTRLDALNRLVIVDACHTAAILNDPRVNAVQRWMEIGSRQARTSYLMASRRGELASDSDLARQGEAAVEIEPLRHGLLTYTLLRGMRAVPLDDEPEKITELSLPEDADFDRDGVLTTGELDTYVKQSLPRIADKFPEIVTARSGNVSPVKLPPPRAEERKQGLQMQSAEHSFPLLPLGRPRPG